MANIGDVIIFMPKTNNKGPVPGDEYVVCSSGPDYVMSNLKTFEKSKMFFINSKPFCEAGPTDVNFVRRISVKDVPILYCRTMDTIKKLISEETVLKEQLKALRVDLKKTLESSEIYKAVLEKTLTDREPKVSSKLAKAHALKVTRAAHESDDEDDEEDT